jgi:hypothetical protein
MGGHLGAKRERATKLRKNRKIADFLRERDFLHLNRFFLAFLAVAIFGVGCGQSTESRRHPAAREARAHRRDQANPSAPGVLALARRHLERPMVSRS